MTNPHEPSYYEIALTNRQVIVAFVLLLLCLVAAFFSGVWVGRESEAGAADQMVRNAPPPQEEKREGQNLEELEFFESDGAARPQQQAEPTPAPPADRDTTLAEDFGAEEEPADELEEPEPEPPTRPRRTPPARNSDAEEVARARPEETPARPRRTPTPAPAAEPARSSGNVVIQVFSSSEQDQAERIRERLVSAGHRAFLSPVEVAGRTMYRVRIGPFGTRDEAQKVAEQVRKGFKLDTWVTE